MAILDWVLDTDSNYNPLLGAKDTVSWKSTTLTSTWWALNVNATLIPSLSTLELIKNQNDYEQTISYLDQWLADERVDTIVHSSVTLWSSVTETFSYVWWAWTYAVSNIALS